MKETKKVGSVLVVGSGIAGMQSALDCANAGYKVYLLEENPAIGGNMARLDKTFPTNDCAMCMISPKLVEVGRHLNIEIISYADLKKVEGEAGNFTVTVNKRARYVDEDKCTGCGQCVEHCLVKNTVYPDGHPSDGPVLDEEEKSTVDAFLVKHKEKRAPLIPVLQDMNEQLNYLPGKMLPYVSEKLNVPLAHILRVATFYSLFSLKPRGKHIINVCLGTACHVRGAGRILEKVEDELGIKTGETTEDKKFSLETVRCLGCCALSPVIKIDQHIHSGVRHHTVMDVLKKY